MHNCTNEGFSRPVVPPNSWGSPGGISSIGLAGTASRTSMRISTRISRAAMSNPNLLPVVWQHHAAHFTGGRWVGGTSCQRSMARYGFRTRYMANTNEDMYGRASFPLLRRRVLPDL